MYNRNNNGPSTVPCGTPESTWIHKECFLSTTTHRLLCRSHISVLLYFENVVYINTIDFIPNLCMYVKYC